MTTPGRQYRGKSGTSMIPLVECPDCGSLVTDTAQHDEFHAMLDWLRKHAST